MREESERCGLCLGFVGGSGKAWDVGNRGAEGWLKNELLCSPGTVPVYLGLCFDIYNKL